MPGPEGQQILDQIDQLLQQLAGLGYSSDSLGQVQDGVQQLRTENESAGGTTPPMGQGPTDTGAPAPAGPQDQIGADANTFGGARKSALADFAKQGHFGKPGGGYDQKQESIARKKKGGAKAR